MSRAPYRPGRAIVLVGPMGAGKSTVGPLLARRLTLSFIDADEEIEREAGLTITGIFERLGETRFRARERQLIARLAKGPPKVIAAGGGAFLDAQIRALVLSRCITVWLDARVETLAARVGDGSNRPLLGGQDPREALAAFAEVRNPLYAEAHARIATDAASPDAIVDEIVSALKARAL